MSILGKAWCELWHSSHNDILTPMSWCVSSGYFKNHWGLKLFLKCHRRSQNVYFFLLGTNTFIKHSGVFFRRSRLEVFCEKNVSCKFHKIHRKTSVPESLFFFFCQGLQLWHKCFPVNFVKFLRTLFFTNGCFWFLLGILFYN